MHVPGRKAGCFVLALASVLSGLAQGKQPPPPFTFALPEHPGRLFLDGSDFNVTELSAKPNGEELGIRAEEKAGTAPVHLLAFLFVYAKAAPLTAAGCRESVLAEEAAHGRGRALLGKREIRTQSGVPVALAMYRTAGPDRRDRDVARAFVAQGDLCADLELFATPTLAADRVDAVLSKLTFDPEAPPSFFGQVFYAHVLEQHEALLPAARVFALAADHADQAADPQMWRRIAVDMASVDYGKAGDLQRSRAINQAAIAKDPDYPMYYYNLACADAEEGNAPAARGHLQQAFDRRANTLKGETMPDPSKDDSLLKLKSDKSFWAYVQQVSAQGPASH